MADAHAVTGKSECELTGQHRHWRWQILLSTYLAYAGFYLCRKVYSIAKPVIMEDLGLDYNQIANIWTAFLVAYMLGQFVTSFLGRKYAPKFLLLAGLGVSLFINIVFGFANNYWTFLVFMVFNGPVQATGWPSSVGAVAHWIRPNERGLIMGIWSTSHVVGTLVVKLVCGVLLAYAGWRWSFWGATMLAAFCWLLLAWRHHDKPEDVGLAPLVDDRPGENADVRKNPSASEHLSIAEYFQLAFHPVILTMGGAYLCVKFLRYLLDSWLPTFLVVLGLDAGQASFYSMFFDICGILPAVLAGWALDRLFRGNWAALSMVAAAGMILGFAVVIVFQGSALAVAISFGIVGFMIYGPETILSGAASVQVAGEKNGLAVAGIVNGLGSIGPIVQEKVVGWIMESDPANGMANANLLCLGLSILFMFLMFLASWRHRVLARRKAEK